MATIRSKVKEAISPEVVVKIEPNVHLRTPIRALSESVVEKFRDLPHAYERFYRPATVSLILGADVYPRSFSRASTWSTRDLLYSESVPWHRYPTAPLS